MIEYGLNSPSRTDIQAAHRHQQSVGIDFRSGLKAKTGHLFARAYGGMARGIVKVG